MEPPSLSTDFSEINFFFDCILEKFENTKKHSVVTAGTKIVYINHKGVRLLDSLKYLTMSLSSVGKAFQNPVSKGHFPIHFIQPENFDHVGDMPANEFYNLENKTIAAKESLIRFLDDFQIEIRKYCYTDVFILASALIPSERDFETVTKVCLFEESVKDMDGILQMLSQRYVDWRMIRLAEKTLDKLPSTHHYYELSAARDYDLRYKTFVTSNFEFAAKKLRSFQGAFKRPIFVDTEHCYETLPHGRKEALLTFCDVRRREILLWRIYTAEQIEKIQRLAEEVAKIRRFASFGRENFFKREIVKNLCYNHESLETYCNRIGAEINKTETMSDWAAPYLRHDQVEYAAFDAFVLKYIFEMHNPEFGSNWKLQQRDFAFFV